jgi:hypothetical protein
MKKYILLFLAVSLPAFAQSNSVYNASNYAYSTQVTGGNAATGSSSILAQPTGFVQGIPFLPYNTNAPITLNRNAANAETITPSALANCYPNSLTCTISGAFVFKHISGESVQSGTFGLQEALNVAVTAGSGSVLIDASWQGPAGSSMITAAKGASTVLIQDNRNPAGATFYQWNGSAYAATGGTGAVSSVFGRTGAVTAASGDYSCAQVTGCPTSTTGIQSINGDATGAQVFAASGSGLSVTHVAGLTTYLLTGGAGTGAVATGVNGQLSGYSANGTTVGPATGLGWLTSGLSQSQINALLSGAGTGTSFIVPAGVTATGGFTPNFNVTMISAQAGASLFNVMGNGVACDERTLYISLTSGSNVATGTGFVPADVGRTIVAAGPFGGTQYVFEPVITAYTNSTTVTISANAPFTQTTQLDPVGTMDTAHIQNIMNHMGAIFPGLLPAGCVMLSDTLYWNAGQRLSGQSSSYQASDILFVDGHDGFAQPDTSGLGGAGNEGAGLSSISIGLGGRVDAAMAPITFVNSAGTQTVQQPLYRPDHYLMSDTADPLAPGWCQGTCQNGVASTTASSAVICVPSSYYARLTAAAGNKILFRDFPAMYTGTVTALSGSGCAGGFNGATISPALPSGGSYTNAQVEWVQSTTGVQTITTNIPAGTVTYPFTVSFSSSIAPTASSIPNFPTHGRLKIANGEEYVYIGCNYFAGSCVIRGGPTTSAGQAPGGSVAPENPCPAAYEQPWPVVPTINTNDSTPSGANYFPSRCIGNAAISFPQANGNVYSQGGLSKGYIKDIYVGVNDTYHSNTLDQNSTACIYMAGNTIPYDSEIGFISCVGTEYGVDFSPASAGMAGVATHAVDSVNSHFHDWTLRTAYGISISSSNQFHLEDVDGYSTAYNPYDGTQMGAGESLMLGFSLNEQTGATVTNTAVCNVSNFNTEPEGGNNDEVPTYFESDCYIAWFQGNNFEGVPAVLGGGKQTIMGGQLSSSAAAPLLNYGTQNVIIGTANTSQGPITTTYGQCSYCDWGSFSNAGTYSANGSGPIIAAGAGNRNTYNGDDSMYAVMGNYSLPSPTNILAGFISNDEMASSGLLKTIDPTAPKGSYTTCTVTTYSSCAVSTFNGFNGGILIGPYDRLQPLPQELTLWMRTASGSNSFLLYVQALNPTAGTCSSPGTIINPTVPVTSTWAAYSFAVNLSSYTGCDIGFSVGPSSTGTTPIEISSPSFIPVAGYSHGRTTTYTAGATCPSDAIGGDRLSFDGTHEYFCSGGVVVAH